MPEFSIEHFVPGGVLPDDRWHELTCDDTCSRCRQPIRKDEFPFLIWSGSGKNMLSYCEKCTERNDNDLHRPTDEGRATGAR